MLTIGPDAFNVEEAEQDCDLSVCTSEEGIDKQDHHHYHILHTTGNVPASFLHYLTNIVSKQGYDVVLLPRKES